MRETHRMFQTSYLLKYLTIYWASHRVLSDFCDFYSQLANVSLIQLNCICVGLLTVDMVTKHLYIFTEIYKVYFYFPSLCFWQMSERVLREHFHPYTPLTFFFFAVLVCLIAYSVTKQQTKQKYYIFALIWTHRCEKTLNLDQLLVLTGMIQYFSRVMYVVDVD